MLNNKQYREREISKRFEEMYKIFDEWDNYQCVNPDFIPKRKIQKLEDSFNERAKELNNLIEAYIGFEDPNYLIVFKERLQKIYKENSSLFYSSYDEESGFTSNNYLVGLRSILVPFPIPGINKYNYFSLLAGRKYLERILYETHLLIEISKRKIYQETSIYSCVKSFLCVLYPSLITGRGYFNGVLKSYNPDVLIPELKTAVEYKYSKSEVDIAKHLDEIVIDAKGYTGDAKYDNFYAVFYTRGKIISQMRFEIAVKQKQLPGNWKCIMVQGK